MKILPLCLLDSVLSNNIYKFCDIHRETVSVGRQATTIASPEFPASFSVQTQCKWIIKSQSGEHIKIEFSDWAVPSSVGGECRVMFVSILDHATSEVNTKETSKKGVNFCGDNPGTFISSGSQIELVIHSDSHPPGAMDLRQFQARISSTKEAPTPVVTGKSYSRGAIDRRFGAPAPRAPPQAPPIATHGAPPVVLKNAMGGYPRQPQGMPPARPRPFGGHQQMHPNHYPNQPMMPNPMGNPVTPRAYYEPAFTRAPDLLPAPGAAPGGYGAPAGVAPRPNPRRVNPLSGIIPKNHAKKPGATREDKQGRVNTKLITKLREMKSQGQLQGMLNGMKQQQAGPLATGAQPAAPGVQPYPGAPGTGVAPPPPGLQAGGVYGVNGQLSANPIQLKHLAEEEVQLLELQTPPPTAQPENNENMNLVIMIAIGTGVITLISIVIVLLFYIHKRVKKQEMQEHQITTQKYMFDHTGLGFNFPITFAFIQFTFFLLNFFVLRGQKRQSTRSVTRQHS